MEEMDALTKMWVSFLAIGLMVAAAFLVTFARYKTKGIIKLILTIVAFVMLLLAIIYALVAIL